MSFLRTILVGAAAGAVVIYLSKKHGSKLVHGLSDDIKGKIDSLAETLIHKVEASQSAVKHGIDKATQIAA